MIRSVLADAIRVRLSDPRIEPLTSITHVDVSADLSVARVHVSVMAPEVRQKLTLEALRSASGRLRSLVSQNLSVRQTPLITFVLDESLQKGFETVRQIDELMVELDGPNREESSFAGEATSPEAGVGEVPGDVTRPAESIRPRGREVGEHEAGREDT